MKTLQDLTPEKRDLIDVYKAKVREMYQGTPWNGKVRRNSIKYIDLIYREAGYKKPVVYFADTPEEYDRMYDRLKLSKDEVADAFAQRNNLDLDKLRSMDEYINDSTDDTSRSHYLWICSPYARCYLAWYHYIHNVMEVPCSRGDLLNEMYDLFMDSSIARCYFTKMYVLVLKNPQRIHFNDDNALHNVHGPAIVYEGCDDFCRVNGREVPKDLIFSELTFEQFKATDDEDIKAAIVTIIKERDGQEALLKFLNAEMVDEQRLDHSDDYYEIVRLYKTKESYDILQDHKGRQGVPYCWSEMVCPSTGQTYLIENSAAFDDALEAVKWLRPSFVPQDLLYQWSEFAN